MSPEQLAYRDALVARQDAALARWPDQRGEAFDAEMHDVAQALATMAQTAERDGDAVEAYRTWRWAGNAWFDGAGGRLGPALQSALQAYRAAEAVPGLVAEPIERLKLDYSLGKALMRLSDAQDRALAEEGCQRLQRALGLAPRYMPQGVETLQTEVSRAQQVLAMMDQVGGLDRRIAELKAQLGAAPAADAPAPAPAPSPDPDRPDFGALFGILKAQVDQAAPGLEPGRRGALDAVMQSLGQMVAAGGQPGRSMTDMLADRGKLESLRRAMEPMVQRPSLAGAGWPAGSRGQRLLAQLQALKMQVSAAAFAPSRSDHLRDAARSLFEQLGRLTTAVSEAGGDAGCLRHLEQDSARALAREVRLFFTRAHTLLAQPVWPDAETPVDVNRVFYAGSDALRADLAAALADAGMDLADLATPGADHAGDRWRSLRTAGVAVFDLAGGSPQVYYELGIALAIGSPLLLLAAEDTVLPFDIAQAVHRLAPEGPARRAGLADALLQAAYGLPLEAGKGSSLAATQAWAARIAPTSHTAAATLRLMHDALDDPLLFHNALSGFVLALRADGYSILQTRWPGDYPDPDAPRHFAVMPFRAEREAAYAVIERAARAAGIEPVRGDQAEGQEIIQSIWQEICRASAVTVDLSGFNLNVCLELGLADALGRPTLLVAEAGTERRLAQALPSVAKRRCLPYAPDPAATPAFEAAVRRFFAGI